jgi:hypothetical protein
MRRAHRSRALHRYVTVFLPRHHFQTSGAADPATAAGARQRDAAVFEMADTEHERFQVAAPRWHARYVLTRRVPDARNF